MDKAVVIFIISLVEEHLADGSVLAQGTCFYCEDTDAFVVDVQGRVPFERHKFLTRAQNIVNKLFLGMLARGTWRVPSGALAFRFEDF